MRHEGGVDGKRDQHSAPEGDSRVLTVPTSWKTAIRSWPPQELCANYFGTTSCTRSNSTSTLRDCREKHGMGRARARVRDGARLPQRPSPAPLEGWRIRIHSPVKDNERIARVYVAVPRGLTVGCHPEDSAAKASSSFCPPFCGGDATPSCSRRILARDGLELEAERPGLKRD